MGLVVHTDPSALLARVRQMGPGGVAGVVAAQAQLDQDTLAATGVPAVMVLNWVASKHFVTITEDEEATSTLAVKHFLDLGIRRVGFVGYWGPPSTRLLTFVQAAGRAGQPCSIFLPEGVEMPDNWIVRTQMLADWAMEQVAAAGAGGGSGPIGFYCFRTPEAQQLSISCTRCGLKVPEQAAILACRGDDIEAHLASPPLSTIDQGGERIGYRAAACLAERMQQQVAGRDPAPLSYLRLLPVGVVRRQSTDVRAVDDPDTGRAFRMIAG